VGLAGKVCVVTGASSGIGRRTSLDLAVTGAKVCIAARREERLRELVAEMGGEDSGHSYVPTDVSDRDQVRRLAAHVRESYGRCDVLVNNAGISGRGTFGPDSVDDVEHLMRVNFFGAVYCTAEFLDLLTLSAPSNVVNVTSVAGRLAPPGFSSYTASKFALVGWTESLQPELARKGIYLSSIEPGFIATEGFPQDDLVGDPVLKRVLGTEAQVSSAIRHAIEHRKRQRVVPRFYYLPLIPKVLAPRPFRFIFERMLGPRSARRASESDGQEEPS
jgi:NAD(P)-dependent dehydrogenase (short-subunit alcohol dehydrogenase family)